MSIDLYIISSNFFEQQIMLKIVVQYQQLKMDNCKIGIIDPVGGHADNFYNYGLCIGLAHNNVKTFYFTSNSTKQIFYDGVNTLFVFKNIWDFKSKFLKLYKYIIGLCLTFKICKKEKIKILHFMVFEVGWLLFFSVIISKLLGFKVVTTVHDIISFTGNRLPKTLERNLLKAINGIIVHNQYCYNEIVAIYPIREYNVIHHGDYTPFVKRVDPFTENQEIFRLLFFGQIRPDKGLDILLNEIRILKDKGIKFKLTIAGRVWKGNFIKYQQLIDQYFLNDVVELNIQYIPIEDVWGYFNAAHLVILPYKKIYQSGVLLMALSYGRAVLTSNIPAFTDLITDNETGFIFNNAVPGQLAAKIELLYHSQSRLTIVEQNVHLLLKEKYNWDLSAQKTKRLYDSI